MEEKAKVGNKALEKLNYREKKMQMLERRKTSFWLDVKLTELEVKHMEAGKNVVE
jgi:hypothetical protein